MRIWCNSVLECKEELSRQIPMAKKRQAQMLIRSVDEWNRWREKNPTVSIDLTEANLRGADLRGAYLSGANLRDANLRGADLSGAYLSGAYLSDTDLSSADLIRAYLSSPNLRDANLSSADLRNSNLRGAYLRGAYLRGADLSSADLSRADLSDANLRGAYLKSALIDERTKLDHKWRLVWKILNEPVTARNLIGVDLSGANLNNANLNSVNLNGANLNNTFLIATQALRANFQGATLTGACLEDWNINSRTNLEGVICEYIYLKSNQRERRPHDPNQNFAPGEFTKLFQKALETVDLIFSDGIDWQAFLASLQKLQVESGDSELAIQAIERKSGGAFVVRVEVPPDANKAEIEKQVKREYDIQLKAIEAKYRLQLNAKDEQIEIYKQNSANIMKMAKLVAKVSNPTIVNIEAKAVAESESKGNTYNQSGNIGIGHMSGGEIKDNVKVAGVINEGNPQNLAEAAAEIQALLEQLEKTYPINTTTEQMLVATKAIEQIESNSTWKQKAIAAFKQGSLNVLETHPIGTFIVGAIKGWQEPQNK